MRRRSNPECVSPTEDLLFEHGLLNRALIVYETIGERLEDGGERSNYLFELTEAVAMFIRHFVEDFHEKLEEDYVFPAFTEARRHKRLIATLVDQHRAGRQVTDSILILARSRAHRSHELARLLRVFVRMYRSHEAFEDTEIFHEFRALIGEPQFATLGKIFEETEDEVFGAKGYDRWVERIAEIERELGTHDLAHVTPRLIR